MVFPNARKFETVYIFKTKMQTQARQPANAKGCEPTRAGFAGFIKKYLVAIIYTYCMIIALHSFL